MRRLVISLTVAATLGVFAPTALAQAQDAPDRPAPCSETDPCAKPFEKNGKWGVRNAQGEVTIEPRFVRARLASEQFPDSEAHGLIIAYEAQPNSVWKFGFINRDGVEIVPPQFTGIWHMAGVFSVMFNDQLCAYTLLGERLLECKYTSIRPVEDGIEAVYRGSRLKFDRAGNEIVQPRQTPMQTAAASASEHPQASARVRDLANTRNWDTALRAAINGTPQDKSYALLRFYDAGSPSDTQHYPAMQVIEQNMGMFDSAIAGVTPQEQTRLRTMQGEMNAYLRNRALGPGAATGSGGYMNARTASECRSSGGSVSVMGYCRR